MEVKPGFKQTELGVIPEDWEVKPLKEISPRQSVGLVINPSTYFDNAGTVPLLVGSNVSENSIDATKANRITRASNEMLSASRLAAGDLVMVRVGEPGVTAVVPAELDGCNCASMMIVRRHPAFDSHWLCYAMNSQQGRKQVEHVQYGTAQKQFNISDAVEFRYPVPPPHEQRAIATALGDVDALLGGLGRLIAKKRDLKQAAMQQLLTGQTRLPGFHGEWEVKRLEKLAEIVSGGTPRTPEPSYWNGGIKWCTPTDITGCTGKYLRETERTISRLGLHSSGARLLPAGALLLCSRATIGEVRIASGEICTNQGFKSLVCIEEVSNEFLYYKLLTLKQKMLERAFGSTFLEISKGNLAAIEVNTPLLPEQTAIAAVLSDMDAELSALEARRHKTRNLKHAMMQEVLTGKTRLVPTGDAHA